MILKNKKISSIHWKLPQIIQINSLRNIRNAGNLYANKKYNILYFTHSTHIERKRYKVAL